MDRATWTGFLWASSPGFRRCSFGSVVLWCWRVTEAFPLPFTPPWTETPATGLGLWGMQLGEFAERLIFHGELQIHWKCLIGTHQFWPMLQTRGVPWECGRSLGCWAAGRSPMQCGQLTASFSFSKTWWLFWREYFQSLLSWHFQFAFQFKTTVAICKPYDLRGPVRAAVMCPPHSWRKSWKGLLCWGWEVGTGVGIKFLSWH